MKNLKGDTPFQVVGTGAVDQDVGELPGLAGAQDVDDPSSCGSSDGLGGILPVPLSENLGPT